MKRNILVLRRCSLVGVSNRLCYTSLASLTSLYPSRRTGRQTSYTPRRPSKDLSMSLRIALPHAGSNVDPTHKQPWRGIVISPPHEGDKVQHAKEPLPRAPLESVQRREWETGGERAGINRRGESDEDRHLLA